MAYIDQMYMNIIINASNYTIMNSMIIKIIKLQQFSH